MLNQFVPILMYHSIARNPDARVSDWVISPEAFEQQMAWLADHHYTTLTVSQLADIMARDGAELPPLPIVLTFDDGFADFYEEALPVLSRHEFTATAYIVTKYVGGLSEWQMSGSLPARPILSWDQIDDLEAQRVECGSHTHQHMRLALLSDDEAYEELTHSKRQLEDRLGHAVRSFAYPYGSYDRRTLRLMRAAGYTSACTVTCACASLRDSAFELPRLLVSPAHDLNAFTSLVVTKPSSAKAALSRLSGHLHRTLDTAKQRRAAGARRVPRR